MMSEEIPSGDAGDISLSGCLCAAFFGRLNGFNRSGISPRAFRKEKTLPMCPRFDGECELLSGAVLLDKCFFIDLFRKSILIFERL